MVSVEAGCGCSVYDDDATTRALMRCENDAAVAAAAAGSGQ